MRRPGDFPPVVGAAGLELLDRCGELLADLVQVAVLDPPEDPVQRAFAARALTLLNDLRAQRARRQLW